MSSTLQLITQCNRIVSSQLQPGSLPALQTDITTVGELFYLAKQVIGTSAESLVYGDMSDECMAIIQNDDATNFVEVGSGSFTAWFKIPPGRRAILPVISSLAAVQLKADTAACNVTVALYKVD